LRNKNTLLRSEEGAKNCNPGILKSTSTRSEPAPADVVRVMVVHMGQSKTVVHKVKSLAQPLLDAIEDLKKVRRTLGVAGFR
jgi:hypothetical protein